MTKPRVIVVEDLEALSWEAARRIVDCSRQAIAERGRFMLALSGGRTPRPIFEKLAALPLREQIDWPRVHVFWTDERCVPPEHEDSNFRLAHDALLRHVPVGHVYRMKGEYDVPAQAAREYEEVLLDAFELGNGGWPRFDLILLGIGADGHVASLFPGSVVLEDFERCVAPVYVDQLRMWRLTLTFPVLNNTRYCLFIASGEGKREVVRKVLDDEETLASALLPAIALREVLGMTTWVVDHQACHFRGDSRDHC